MTAISIRNSHPSDLPSLYSICHATGLNGRDASPSVDDPELIGHSYVGPYAVLEPETCFVAVQESRVVGYIVAAADSRKFHEKCEALWFPVLRARYPVPTPEDTSSTALFTRTLHRGHPPSDGVDLAAYPASLHIDLLPRAQGQGVGRQLMDRLFARLREKTIQGVHLYVGRSNIAAIGFYERIGFQCIDDAQHARGYGFKLS
jgi:ribosomal protein S18 acetylase RimI-like enzyme